MPDVSRPPEPLCDDDLLASWTLSTSSKSPMTAALQTNAPSRKIGARLGRLLIVAALGFVAPMAHAVAASTPLVTDVLPSGVPLPAPAPDFAPAVSDASTELLGNAGGVRPWLDRHGVQINLQDVEELWGLASGGVRPGPTYDGITAVTLQLNTQQAFGWHDGLFNISALQIRGRSLTNERLQSLNAVSGYDAGRSTRLFELWYGQGFFGNRLDVRVGSVDLDTEFLVSQNASLFLNASFGWPLSTSSNLYSGGPSWPYSAVGVRVKWAPAHPLVLMGAVTDDNPTHGPFYSSVAANQRDPSGTQFSTEGGALFIGEAQLWVDAARRLATGDSAALPGTWKVGALFDTGRFPDQRYDDRGGLLGSPESDGRPFYHRGNWMAYTVIDQMLWRAAKGQQKAISVFIRATANDGVRNRFSSEVEAGLTFDGLVPGRIDDTIGVAWGTTLYGRRALKSARDAMRLGGSGADDLKPENHLELTWQIAVTPYLNLQPDLQYFWNVGGVARSSAGGIANGFVAGLNMTTTF